MNVAIAINGRYVRYAYVMLYSLFSNNKNSNICVYVLHQDLEKEDKKLLNNLTVSA